MSLIPVTDVLNGISEIPNVFDPDGLRDVIQRPDVDFGRPSQVSSRPTATDAPVNTVGRRRSWRILDTGPVTIPSVFENGIDFATDEELLAAEDAAIRSFGPVRLKELRARGIDALAWYLPFHTRRPDWGIHIPISSIALFARDAFSSVASTATVRWKLALRALHSHELNHFAVEYFTAVWELLHGERTFFPSLRHLRSWQHGYVVLEERLANADMIRSVRTGGEYSRVKGKTAALRNYIRTQPPGYCQAGSSTSDTRFFPLVQRVLKERVQCTSVYSPRRHDRLLFRTLVEGFPEVDWRECPVHLYDDHWHYGNSDPIAWFIHRLQPSIQESTKFARQLERLDESIAYHWVKTKQQLLNTTSSRGLDFKKWPPGGKGAYSVRVTHSHRAHLRFESPTAPWVAEEIGGHKEMGHG